MSTSAEKNPQNCEFGRMISKEAIAESYRKIQQEICAGLEEIDGQSRFSEEPWERPGGGGGLTRVIQQGRIIEKGGVNFSAVHGSLPPAVQKAFGVDETEFFATGVSIVLHPNQPWVPIIHMNIRYFELNEDTRWFGGGIDVTPHYIIPEQAAWFHRYLKKVCDGFSADFYSKFSDWADRYFYIPHRKETRGIGGIFYDRLNPSSAGMPWENILAFSEQVGRSFVPVYRYLVEQNQDKSFGEAEKQWQFIRRSRYAEFNLIYDAGTKFGLETEGRIESILMSMPPMASWVYNFQPEPGSEEEKTLSLLRQKINWESYA